MMKFEKYFAQCEQFKKVKVLALNLLLCFLSNWKGEILLLLYARHLWPSATPGNWPSWLYSDPINNAKNKQTLSSVFHHIRRAVTRVMPAESGDWSIIASPPTHWLLLWRRGKDFQMQKPLIKREIHWVTLTNTDDRFDEYTYQIWQIHVTSAGPIGWWAGWRGKASQMQKPLTKRRLKSLPRVKNRLGNPAMWELLHENTWGIRVGNHAKKGLFYWNLYLISYFWASLHSANILYDSDGVRERYLFEIMWRAYLRYLLLSWYLQENRIMVEPYKLLLTTGNSCNRCVMNKFWNSFDHMRFELVTQMGQGKGGSVAR